MPDITLAVTRLMVGMSIDGNIDFLEEQYINRMASLIGMPTRSLAELKAKEENLFPDLKHTNRHTATESA